MEGTQQRLGRYELLARLATGGMGEVFLARLEGAEGFEKLYAVKRILPHLAKDERFRKMMIAEAQIASRMAHSNICQVYELGETNGQLYIVMEYLEGVTLLSLLRKCSRDRTALPLGFVSSVIGQVSDALQYAHDLRDRNKHNLNLVHRDVTPANVFICESGQCKVLDFGIAKMRDTASTQTDTVKGKFAYMAPEQLKGKQLTRRVDVFALGVVTFEALALRKLFQRKTDYLTFQAVMELPIADVRRYRPELPDSLVAALARALERRATDRFDTVRALRAALFEDPLCKPWTQEEVGELIRTQCAREIGVTHRGVATAIMRKGPPPEEPIVSATPGDDDDEDFPAVETDAQPLTSELRASPAMIHTQGGVAPTGSSMWRWIGGTLALALVVAAGTALYLFWIGWFPSGDSTKDAGVIEAIDATRIDADSKCSDGNNQQAVEPFLPALGKCASKNPSQLGNVTVVMFIGADGTMQRTRFEPELDNPALGECLLGVLETVPYRCTNVNGTSFSLEIKLPPTPKKNKGDDRP